MAVLDQAMFDKIVSYSLGGVSDHKNPKRITKSGIFFDKKNKSIVIASPFTLIEISNIEIGNIVPDDAPFFNSPMGEFRQYPFTKSVEELYAEIGEFKPVGHVTYSATDIINILEPAIRHSRDRDFETPRSKNDYMNRISVVPGRYVFVQGFLPEGCAPVKFKNVGGRPSFSLKGVSKPFVISSNSNIPEKYVVPDKCYACRVTETPERFELDVVSLFGKTKSGLVMATGGYYDHNNLELINRLEGLYTDMMVCSDLLVKNEECYMPPIHLTVELLYDTLKMFMLAEVPLFDLIFQEEVNSHILLQSKPQNDNEILIRAYMAVKDLTYKYQIG